MLNSIQILICVCLQNFHNSTLTIKVVILNRYKMMYRLKNILFVMTMVKIKESLRPKFNRKYFRVGLLGTWCIKTLGSESKCIYVYTIKRFLFDLFTKFIHNPCTFLCVSAFEKCDISCNRSDWFSILKNDSVFQRSDTIYQ